MKVIKRRDYSNGVLSLSSKPLRIRHHLSGACRGHAVFNFVIPCINQTSCHITHLVGCAIPPSYSAGGPDPKHLHPLMWP